MLQKIVLVINKPERETRTLEKIRSAIQQISPHTEVHILEFCEPEFVPKVLEIAPSVITTFPLTGQALPQRFYILKYLLNCRLVCFRTEGLLSNESQERINAMAGIGKYGANLVDYEIFWGPKPAELLRKVLLEQGKISSGDRIRFLGWPFLEDYFKPDSEFEGILPDKIKSKLNQYAREKSLLFVTGFSVGDYSPDNIINADDIVDTSKTTAQKVFEERLALGKKVKQLQQMWIKDIIRNAENTPNLLFVVKMHPHEIGCYRSKKFNPYSVFHNYNNILLIEEAIPFRAIISHCSILFHYGSTAMLESYLSKIPSVYVYARELKEICNDLSSSTISVEIHDIASVISHHVDSPLKFKQSHEVEKYLEDMVDLKIGQDYRPSERIGRFLLSLVDEHPQVIAADDKYLVNAYEQSGSHNFINTLISKAVKSINDGDFQRALTIYLDNVVVKLAKIAKIQIPDLQYLRSICLYKMGFIDRSIAAVNQELTFNPQNEQAKNLRSQLHSLSKKTEGIKINQTEDFDRMIPKTFQVETVAGCNLKCPEYAVGADIITHRKKGSMSFDEFKVIADKIRPFCEYLFLHIWGEPLLNKDIFKIIQYASAFTKTNISTNGNCSNISGTLSVDTTWEQVRRMSVIRLYAGDVPKQKEYEGVIGLSLTKNDQNHLQHDITQPFPLIDNSVDSFQAEDVIEHIPYEKLAPVINEIYRILKPGGLFRLSVPDYGCDVLQNRLIKDEKGQIVFDPGDGGTPENPGHVWFPRIDTVMQLLTKTKFHGSGKIELLHYYNKDGTFVAKPIDYSKGHIMRTPDFDERVKAPYRPMSLVIDLTKGREMVPQNSVKPAPTQLYKNSQNREEFLPLMTVKNDKKSHYGKEYFDWQKDIGRFGGVANLFKFKEFINANDTIVDFGCGGGYLLRNLQCKEKMGIEVNPHARQEAKGNGIKVVESADEVPDKFADIIISNHALEHVGNPLEVLKKLRKKLKNNGKIIFVVPHQDTREEYDSADKNKHLYTWNQMTLGNLFSEAGYEVLKAKAFQHQWPPNYLEIYSRYGEEEFHRRCGDYAIENNNYQIRIVGIKA